MRSQCISRPRTTCVLADDRDVVLGLAGDDARVAADAGVQVDRHAPRVALVLASLGYIVRPIERLVAPASRRTSGPARTLRAVGRLRTRFRPSMRPVILRRGERVAVARLRHRRRRRRTSERAVVRSVLTSKPDAVADAARALAAVAQMQRRSSRRRVPAASQHRACAKCLPPCFSSTTSPLTRFERGRARAAADEQRGVVPGELRQRLGQLLQPAVVGVAAVVDTGIGPEDDLAVPRRAAAGAATDGARLQRDRPWRERGVRSRRRAASAASRCRRARARRFQEAARAIPRPVDGSAGAVVAHWPRQCERDDARGPTRAAVAQSRDDLVRRSGRRRAARSAAE